MKAHNRSIASLLIIAFLHAGLPLPIAHAEMVPTTAALADLADRAVPAHPDRARMQAMIERHDMREALQTRGIGPEEAQARVAALSDDEVATLAKHMDSLPAGADGLLGLVFLTFIILLFTDIFGFTKVFPFTRSIK